jgi:catechol 2,3-dioxygenase-like lactoylglutathione lyase family enzyme
MLHHASIFVADLDRSAAFYADLLGLRETNRTTLGDMGIELVFLTAGRRHGDLVLARRADGAAPPADKHELFHLAFELPRDRPFRAFAASLTADGIPFHGPVEHEVLPDGSGVRDAVYLTDPDGHLLEITQDR